MQNEWQYGLKGVNQWININIIGSMYVNLSGYDNLREMLNNFIEILLKTLKVK